MFQGLNCVDVDGVSRVESDKTVVCGSAEHGGTMLHVLGVVLYPIGMLVRDPFSGLVWVVLVCFGLFCGQRQLFCASLFGASSSIIKNPHPRNSYH